MNDNTDNAFFLRKSGGSFPKSEIIILLNHVTVFTSIRIIGVYSFYMMYILAVTAKGFVTTILLAFTEAMTSIRKLRCVKFPWCSTD